MKYIELFSGIGGFKLGINNGIKNAECVAWCEIDKYARKSYEVIYGLDALPYGNAENTINYVSPTGVERSFIDITKVPDSTWGQWFRQVDLVAGGSPCQSFSIAGKREGFEDTRGTLFFEYARCLKFVQPKAFIFENVEGLLHHDGGKTFEIMAETFCELGYIIDFDVYNSANYGVPQHRERIYVIGIRKDIFNGTIFTERQNQNTLFEQPQDSDVRFFTTAYRKYRKAKGHTGNQPRPQIYPERESGKTDLGGILNFLRQDFRNRQAGLCADEWLGCAIKSSYPPTMISPKEVSKGKSQTNRLFDTEGLSKTVGSGRTEINFFYVKNNSTKTDKLPVFDGDNVSLQPSARGSVRGGYSGAVRTSPDAVYNDYTFRRLTPLECWRLQGFPDWSFSKAQAVNSDTQLYRQAGNAVTVNVVSAIVNRMRRDLNLWT
jgi:DNA (cytosine-5)-methyltransferase 1